MAELIDHNTKAVDDDTVKWLSNQQAVVINVNDINQLQPLGCNLPPINNIEPFDYKKCLYELEDECQRMAQLRTIQATNKTSLQMEQQTPTPPENPPCTQQMTIHLQSINDNLPLVDADKPFNYNLCLIVLDKESQQMAQWWPIIAIDDKHPWTKQIMPPTSLQNPPCIQPTITHLHPLGSNLPQVDAAEPFDYKWLLNAVDNGWHNVGQGTGQCQMHHWYLHPAYKTCKSILYTMMTPPSWCHNQDYFLHRAPRLWQSMLANRAANVTWNPAASNQQAKYDKPLPTSQWQPPTHCCCATLCLQKAI